MTLAGESCVGVRVHTCVRVLARAVMHVRMRACAPVRLHALVMAVSTNPRYNVRATLWAHNFVPPKSVQCRAARVNDAQVALLN